MGSLADLGRIAKSDMYAPEPPPRRIPGQNVAMGSGAAILGGAAYVGRKAKITAANKSGLNTAAPWQAKYLRRKAGKAAVIGGSLLAAGYGIKRLNDGA